MNSAIRTRILIGFLWLGSLFSSPLEAQIINFTDPTFKNALVNYSCVDLNNSGSGEITADTNGDGEIQVSEALAVQSLAFYFININSLAGISHFTNLTKLTCVGTQLNTADLTSLQNLTSVYMSNNQFSALDLQTHTQLTSVICKDNPQLTSLKLQGLNKLTYLQCQNNKLSAIQGLSSLIKLDYLDCNNNLISSLNLDNLVKINWLNCGSNQITTLDVSQLRALNNFYCAGNNLLQSIYMKNGKTESNVEIFFTPNLSYVCTDEADLLNIISVNLPSTCAVNSYCSFTPGGTFYTIGGTSEYDLNGNGCTPSDPNFPNLRININEATTGNAFVQDATGQFEVNLPAGQYTLTPKLPNNTYFQVSPMVVNVNFPNTVSPFSQSFCIMPDGVHHDVEVFLFPLIPIRPGFDATFGVAIKNKGTSVENGTLKLLYDESRLDFVSADLAPSSQTSGSLQWSFSNLQPFETKYVTLVLNANSPMEIPAVNAGTLFTFNASATLTSTDEYLLDNNFTLNQIAVNSFDPNDKTCQQGNALHISKLGEFLHYTIRFENTGTAPAENIVVRDVIDTTRFDISSFQFLTSSHNARVRVKSTNILEFIFENIQLPFQDATNDGYLTFKIKSKTNLALGQQIKNKAEIYFDFNYPIITDEAITVITNTSAAPDLPSRLRELEIYPNPAKDLLYIKSPQPYSYLIVSDIHGRELLRTHHAPEELNIEQLPNSCQYIVRIVGDNWTNTKVITVMK